MVKTQKYYVVWSGRKTGVFDNWADCKASVEGFADARYKSFETFQQAIAAFESGFNRVSYYDETTNPSHFTNLRKKNPNTNKGSIYTFSQQKVMASNNGKELLRNQLPILDSLCVDAACSGNPGIMEYRGVYILNGKQIFYYKHPYGTNNIGEFLGIVHGLSYLKRHNLPQPLYTDSGNAIKWVMQKKCKTKLALTPKTADLFDYIQRAEKWLQENTYTTQIIKWNTDHWGEIPADFGRKK